MWHRVVLVWTDPSEECIASNFRVEKSVSEEPAWAGGCRLADFSALKLEAIRSSETSVHTRTTWRHIPENGILHCHRHENLKSYTLTIKFANSPPCTCWGSSGQKPQDGLMTLIYQVYYLEVVKSCVKKLGGNDLNFFPTTHVSCIMTMHLLTRHCLWGSF
jgi:hypothetical protein